MKNNEQGSIFFYILIGIALFAGLTYAVTQSTRVTDGSTPERERVTLQAIDMASFLEAVKQQTIILSKVNGVSQSTLDFRNDVFKLANDSANTNNTNATCTTSSCRVFSPYGTNAVQPMIFINGLDTTAQTNNTLPKNGHGQVWQVIVNGVGSSAPDLAFLIHGVSANFCNVYNARVGLTTTYTSSTTLTSIGETPSTSRPVVFAGTFNTTNQFGEQATIFKGKKSFCAPAYLDGEIARLAIWNVVLAR